MTKSQATTIYALSSGRLPAAIAIIRLSGPHAFTALGSMIGPLPPARQLVRRRLVDSESNEIDTAMVVRFAAPASPTGEDVVEFHLHGGVAVVAAMLKSLAAMPNTMLAERGAFTRRAFDNGRLNLAQVEGLADLIEAETESQRRLALGQVTGELYRHVNMWRIKIIDARASVEAMLDFAEEDETIGRQKLDIVASLVTLRNQLAAAVVDMHRANMIRDGVTIAITGPVNSGKSSLINLLAARDISIVSDTPGTTRDVIEARLNLDGIAVTILDTAGVRPSTNNVEIEGIRRGQVRANSADLVISIGDPTMKAGLSVISKSDQLAIEAGWHDEILYISSVTGEGIDLLMIWLSAWVQNLVRPSESILLTQKRHTEAVKTAIAGLDLAIAEDDILLISDHLRVVTNALRNLTGQITSDELLGSIFARFCIGK